MKLISNMLLALMILMKKINIFLIILGILFSSSISIYTCYAGTQCEDQDAYQYHYDHDGPAYPFRQCTGEETHVNASVGEIKRLGCERICQINDSQYSGGRPVLDYTKERPDDCGSPYAAYGGCCCVTAKTYVDLLDGPRRDIA